MTITLNPKKVPWQPVAVFAVLAVALLSLTWVSTSLQKRGVRRAAETELAAVANLRAVQVASMVGVRLGLGRTLSENAYFAARVQDIVERPERAPSRAEVLETLSTLRKNYPYRAAGIVLPGGRVVLTFPDGERLDASAEIVRAGHEAWQAQKAVLSDFYRDQASGRIGMSLLVPLQTFNGDEPVPVALLRFDLDPAASLFPLLQTWPTPSPTGESLLVRREKEDFIYLSEPRLKSDVALALRLPVGRFRRSGAAAGLGDEGLVEGTDYRGRRVLAFIASVPETDWLLEAKTDLAEIDARSSLKPGLWGLLTLGLILAAGLALTIFWQAQKAASFADERRRWTDALDHQRDFLHVMLDVMPNPAYLVDEEGAFAWCNAGFEKVSNLSKDKIIGKRFADIVPAALAAKDRETDEALRLKPGVQVYEAAMKTWDGSDHELIFIKSTYPRPDGNTGGMIVTLIDITQRKRNEEELQQIKKFSDGIVHTMTEGLVLTDQQGRFSFVNPAAAALLGYAPEDMVDREVVSFVAGNQRDVVARADERRAQGISDRYELIFLHKDGTPRTLLVSGGPRFAGTHYGGTMAVLTDITERKRMEEEIHALSLTDELTRLFNRRGFETLAEHQLKTALRLKKRVFLLFLDVDDLKHINDTFGHKQGDKALAELAGILQKSFRDSDIVARWGGDEFVVMAMETARVDPAALKDRLAERLEFYNSRGGGPRDFRLSASVGIATFDPEYPATTEDLIVQADRAMYLDKRGKKGS